MKLGENLPKNRPIRLFHSGASRCKNTSVAILKGIQNSGGSVDLQGYLPPLSNIGGDCKFITAQAVKYSGIKFIIRWAAGLYPDLHLIPFTKYCKEAAITIWNKLLKALDSGIDIYITHDLHIIAMKFGWFGQVDFNNWVSFLGGFAISIKKDNLIVFDGSEFNNYEIPFWWNNL